MQNPRFSAALAAAVIYAAVTLIFVLNHEVWADEAQVFLLCRKLSLIELVKHINNEGHPALFYFITKPFAVIFNDIIWMKLICWGFMTAAVFVLMYFSPFMLYAELSIIISAGFLYFLPVMARSYALLPFLLFSAALLYKKSSRHPVLYSAVLAAAANTHAVMYVFCASLAALFIFDSWKNRCSAASHADRKISILLPFLIIAAGFSAPAYTFLHGAASSSCYIHASFNLETAMYSAKRVLRLFFLNAFNYDSDISTAFSPIFNNAAIALNIMLFCLIFILIYKNSRRLFFCALFGIGFQIYIYIFVYGAFIYTVRIFTAYLILAACCWIILEKDSAVYKKLINAAVSVLFAVTFFNGAAFIISDIKKDYSDASGAAEFIQKNINAENSIILADDEPVSAAVIYYLKNSHDIYSAFRNRKIEYALWDKTSQMRLADEGWKIYIERIKKADKEYYVINPKADELSRLDVSEKEHFDLIYISPETVDAYGGYRIFKYKPSNI